eukprot:2451094-Amphidinium_carterae.1
MSVQLHEDASTALNVHSGMGPFMYTAFLQISLAFSYPVGPHSEAARIPGLKFIGTLAATVAPYRYRRVDPESDN